MNSFIHGSIFDSKSEAIVIPVSVYGDTSNPFYEGLSKSNLLKATNVEKERYNLGEIHIQDVSRHKHLKYIIYACSVTENDNSSYTAIRQIGRELGSRCSILRIKSLSSPILGTGAGGLDHNLSRNILFSSFYETANSNILFDVYCPDKVIYDNLNNIPQDIDTPSSRIVFDAELPRVLQTEKISHLRYSSDFYFDLATKKFREYFNFNLGEKQVYQSLINSLKNYSSSFGHFLSEFNSSSKEYKFLLLCGELVAYIDYHAYFKNLWNQYPDKRVLALSSVRQKSWIINLIGFKEHNRIELIHGTSIRNALLYFSSPESRLTMLSENHRKNVIAQIILKKDYEDSNNEIVLFFKNFKINCNNHLNDGVLYSEILYYPTIKPLWFNDSKNFILAGKEPVEKINQGLVEATSLIYDCLKNKIKKLDIGNCGISNLNDIPELFECTQLEELILSNEWARFEEGKWKKYTSANNGEKNKLDHLSSKLGELTNLKMLICGGDWNEGKNSKPWMIQDTSSISKLHKLEYLNLSNNKITSLKGFKNLKKLRILHLNNNELFNINALSELHGLQEVYLSNNNIEDVSPIHGLNNLTTIDLHANKIRDVRPLESLISLLNIENTKWKLHTINIAKNPLERPPVEIITSGKDAIIQYFKDTRNPKKVFVNKDIKVILVGNSEVGKTTLAKYLNNEKELEITHSATHWMEEIEVLSKFIIDGLDDKCIIHLFDFGGHDYYHDTHHLFYGTNTIYILLWDIESNKFNTRKLYQKDSKGNTVSAITQDFPIDYWLDSIRHFIKDVSVDNFEENIKLEDSFNSFVLLLQNKAKRISDVAFLNNKFLTEKYPFIFDFINVSVKEKRNMNHFDNLFTEALSQTGFIGSIIPQFYQEVKESIKKYDGKPIILLDEFYQYCNHIITGGISIEQTKYLASYLKNIGVILWYPENNNDRIYIKKKWILEKIYLILEDLHIKKGEFDDIHLEECLGETDKAFKSEIIDIMLDFKIIFKHPYEEKYIAPLYLPPIPPDSIKLFLTDKLIPYRRLEYIGYIHKHIILKFFQEYGMMVLKKDSSSIEKSSYYYWKDAIIIKNPLSNDIAMVKFNGGTENGKAYIDIFAVNKADESFFRGITQYLLKINDGYELEELVTLDGVNFISKQVLIKNAQTGKLIFSQQRISEKKGIKQDNEKLFKLIDYKMYIEEEIKKKKVVISYSKKDISHVHTLRRYLQPLVDKELIEQPWYCTDLKAAEEWNETIKKRFEEADIVFFMISEYFYSTKYIVEHEIKEIIKRYDGDKSSVKIIPIILEFYDWERKKPYNLQRFTALPFQAKPISDFNNPKMAWYTIAESVKMMIEKDLNPENKDSLSRELQEIYERQVEGKLNRNS